MKKYNQLLQNNIFRIFVFTAVLYFTFVLRAHNYEKVPTPNHLDEMLYAWSGIHLVETGVPVSWSTLDYPDYAEVYSGRISYKGGLPETYATLYKPWLDQPPVFSLIVGWSAHLFGADRSEFIPSSYIRLPVIFISTLTSVMIFLIARFVSGYWTGILAMLLYGTIPLMVFASRTAMPENMIALMLSIMVYLLLKFQINQKFLYIVPIPLLIGLAGLSKPTGYFLLPLALYLTVIALYEKSKNLKLIAKYSLYLILGTIPFIGVFFVYGLYYDPDIFWRITSIQSNRPAGFGSLAWYFITPSYDTAILRDSWFVFALLSAAYFIFNPKENLQRLITLIFIYSVIIVMISGGENDLLAWYRFPSYPMLAILTAWGVQHLVKRADFFSTFFAAGMLLGNRVLLVNSHHQNIMAMSYRYIFSALMLPSVLLTIFNTDILRRITRMVIILIIVAGIYMNVSYVYSAYEISCEHKTCPMVPTTFLSTIHYPFIWRLFDLD